MNVPSEIDPVLLPRRAEARKVKETTCEDTGNKPTNQEIKHKFQN
jgi:hypothetical protein